jgi:hypothetical protein
MAEGHELAKKLNMEFFEVSAVSLFYLRQDTLMLIIHSLICLNYEIKSFIKYHISLS